MLNKGKKKGKKEKKLSLGWGTKGSLETAESSVGKLYRARLLSKKEEEGVLVLSVQIEKVGKRQFPSTSSLTRGMCGDWLVRG